MNSFQHMFRFFGFPEPMPVEGAAQVRRRRGAFDGVPLSVRAGSTELQSLIARATAGLVRKNQLLEAANQAKTHLFAAAIHDLRQPLQALMLFSDALSSVDLDADQLHQRIDQIHQSVDSLDRLLTGLLDLTQIDAAAHRQNVPIWRSIRCSTRSAITSAPWPRRRECDWWCAPPARGRAATA